MEVRVLGYDMQHVRVYLQPSEIIYGEGGHLVAKSPSVSIAFKAQGGLLKSLERELTGSRFFITELTGPGMAEFSSFLPGRVIQVHLEGNGIKVESNSFLFAEAGVQYSASLAPLGAGILGGEGILLANFRGNGNVFLHALGGVSSFVLRQGEEIEIEAEHLLAFDENMQVQVTRLGNLRTMLLGAIEQEGIFFVKVTGPGRVWVHNTSLGQLVGKLSKYFPAGGGGGPSVSLGGFQIGF
ncbi:AIM24 family protein [Sulfuracidifex metallicus]|uniref:Transcriptional regulator n=1 Tax=Sulfuracidifex metallicus DSM 6482 = JCM 9184 TaxID=523847 RepID=A0A6A9QPT1_SULME|nr:AIM24 family protein [Sulfuracidifex metallicus]MUN29768.1 transcriptional regulator [Sulfuracidifex metallicus DSM 6482 = JCM 9184]WOE51851.1 AIM24 family protein [Sulfuracidifex metallicus DSM 6482 = JCM 9184]